MARTTRRSRSGKKLYAVRDKQGRFKDIQSYKRHTARHRRRRGEIRRTQCSHTKDTSLKAVR